ncbi:MAG: hypothetical protein CM15mP125_0730 [Gammaproteobacteria bacterium]|nr:MAG: hypothetical protein CM15mP125_0730 [Gammaproteobacteria bacterium]
MRSGHRWEWGCTGTVIPPLYGEIEIDGGVPKQSNFDTYDRSDLTNVQI